jgi:hypothetical protein
VPFFVVNSTTSLFAEVVAGGHGGQVITTLWSGYRKKTSRKWIAVALKITGMDFWFRFRAG